MTEPTEDNPYEDDITVEVSPRAFIRETDNILAVELFPNGEKVPLIFYTIGGRRYLVETRMWDVTESKFYAKRGLKERLAAAREEES